MNNQKVEQALKEIFDRYGAEMIHNRARSRSAVLDLLPKPSYPDELLVLNNAMESDSFWILLAAASISDKTAIKTVEQLKKERHMTEEDAEFVVRSIIVAHGENPDMLLGTDKERNTRSVFLAATALLIAAILIVWGLTLLKKENRGLSVLRKTQENTMVESSKPETTKQETSAVFEGEEASTASKGAETSAAPTEQEKTTVSADFEYTVYDTYVSIDQYTGSDTSVMIPAQIEGKPVTAIGSAAFEGCSNLTSVIIPENVTIINVAAFSNCSSLTSVSIPEGLTVIGEMAFCNCGSLTDISLPDSVVLISNGAFSDCVSLTDLTLPARLEGLGNGAFYNCVGLTSLEIPAGVSWLGSSFGNCHNLSSVSVSAYTAIFDTEFENCPNLTVTRYGLQETGNTSGNINNMGLAVEKEGWVYYADVTDGWLCKSNGTDAYRLTEDPSCYINVLGDWIYYCADSDYTVGDIYRVRKDGTGRERVAAGACSHVIVTDEWIYYIDGKKDDTATGTLMRLSTALNRVPEAIAKCSRFSGIAVAGDWIYYGGSDTGNLCRIRNDGTDAEVLTEEYAGSIQMIDGWIYYESSRFSLCRITGDGIGEEEVLDISARFEAMGNDNVPVQFTIADDWVYFETISKSFAENPSASYEQQNQYEVWRIRIEGSAPERIGSGCMCPNVMGDWLYFIAFPENGGVFLMRALKNGGSPELMPVQ